MTGGAGRAHFVGRVGGTESDLAKEQRQRDGPGKTTDVLWNIPRSASGSALRSFALSFFVGSTRGTDAAVGM